MATARGASFSPLAASGLRIVHPSRFILLGVTIFLFVAAAVFIPHFFNWGNVANLLQRNSIVGIIACGTLLMIILGGDHSAGRFGDKARRLKPCKPVADILSPSN
jgi:ABC-type xylose transport system permease subunit